MIDDDFLRRVSDASEALRAEGEKARQTIAVRERGPLDLCLRLLAVARVALEAKKGELPSSGWKAIVLALLMKVISTVQAAHTLSAAGHAREVGVLVRSALEGFITAAFISKEDSDLRARRWAEYGELQKARVLKKHPQLSSSVERQSIAEEILAHAAQLEELFPNKAFWASGLHHGNIRDLAEAVDMGWYYDIVYWSGSQATHSSAIAIGLYIDITPEGNARYKMGLSSEHLRGELAACCDVLVRTLAALNDLFELGLEKIDLISEYKTAFGEDALTDAAPP